MNPTLAQVEHALFEWRTICDAAMREAYMWFLWDHGLLREIAFAE